MKGIRTGKAAARRRQLPGMAARSAFTPVWSRFAYESGLERLIDTAAFIAGIAERFAAVLRCPMSWTVAVRISSACSRRSVLAEASESGPHEREAKAK